MQLNDVKWTKGDDTEITSGGAGSFIIDDGSTSAGFSGNTQITTLTVPDSQTDQDKTYKCLITSVEHGQTEKSTSVNLKVFSK